MKSLIMSALVLSCSISFSWAEEPAYSWVSYPSYSNSMGLIEAIHFTREEIIKTPKLQNELQLEGLSKCLAPVKWNTRPGHTFLGIDLESYKTNFVSDLTYDSFDENPQVLIWKCIMGDGKNGKDPDLLVKWSDYDRVVSTIFNKHLDRIYKRDLTTQGCKKVFKKFFDGRVYESESIKGNISLFKDYWGMMNWRYCRGSNYERPTNINWYRTFSYSDIENL